MTLAIVKSAIFRMRREIAIQFYLVKERKGDYHQQTVKYDNCVFPSGNVDKLAKAFLANPHHFAKLDPEDMDQNFQRAKKDLKQVGFKNERLDFPNGFGHRIVQRLRKKFLHSKDLPHGNQVP